MSVVPRDMVARALNVALDELPPGDLPITRLAERFLGFLTATQAAETPEKHPEFWTYLLVSALCEREPDLALDLVIAALPLCDISEMVATLAAGPLEDLLSQNGAEVIDRVEEAAGQSPRFRFALSGVWPEGNKGLLWARIAAAQGDGPTLDDNAPLPPS